MKTATSLRNALVLLAILGLAAPALAALDIERSVTVTDEAGGTLVLISSGVRDELGAESTTSATFTDFQPRSEGREIDGEVIRNRVRTADQLETVYDGALEIFTPSTPVGPERLDTLVFESLRVVRDGDGPVLSGTIVYNGEVLDAAELPRAAARILARTLRFFQLA